MTFLHVLDVVALVFLLLASMLCLVAALGLLRFPDLLSRMHAITKPQVLGTLLALVGIGLAIRDVSAAGILILIGLFQLVTVPITSHMMSRAALRAGQIDLNHGGRDVVVSDSDELVARDRRSRDGQNRDEQSIIVSADDDLDGPPPQQG